MITNTYIKEHLKATFFIILFIWLSFFPQPLQDRYWIYVRIFLGIFLIIQLLNRGYFKFLFSVQDWSLWLFLMSILAGIISALNRTLAFKTYLYLVITFFFLFYIGKGLYRDEKDGNIVCIVICMCSTLVALGGILELYFGKNILYENLIVNPFYSRYVKYYPRPMSTQFNPAILGSYLLGCLPFNFYFFRKKLLYLRLLGIFSSLLCIGVIVLTFSRGVFLGLIALLVFYLWKIHGKKFLIIFLFCLVLFISICSYHRNINLNRFGFNRLLRGSYDSLISEYRLERAKMTIKILKDYLFSGIGFNHFRIRFNEYCNQKDKGKELYEFMIPDNMYLSFLAETGTIGTLGFLVFIFFLLKRGLINIKELKNENKKYLLLISMSALIGLLVNMGAYELFYWSSPYMLFCLICGFVSL